MISASPCCEDSLRGDIAIGLAGTWLGSFFETAHRRGCDLSGVNLSRLLFLELVLALVRPLVAGSAASFATIGFARRFAVGFRIEMSAAADIRHRLMPSEYWELSVQLIYFSSAALFGSYS